jgi:glycosyltransferase involved in cell wall biosynthesis
MQEHPPAPIRLLSVIMPTRNRAHLLSEQLDAFAGQTHAGAWELVVVDNGSVDRTAEVVQSFADRIPVRLVPAVERAGIAFARNAGAAHARGDYLLFVDDDDHVLPGWLDAMARAAARSQVIGGRERWFRPDVDGGASHPVSETTDLDRAFGFLPIVSGSNGGVSRALFERVGGFSERYRRCDDIDFFWRAQLASGRHALFVEDAVLEYRLRPGVRPIWDQAYADAREVPQLYRHFRVHGMPRDVRSSTAAALRIARYGPRWIRSERGRRELAKEAGWLVGRTVGSVRAGVLYL